MIRELVSRFSTTLAERRASVRKKCSVPVKVCFAPEKNTANLKSSCEELFLSGETLDVSETGIAFIVSSIRIKEKYLVGQERVLNVEMDLSGSKVRMKVLGVRYERVGIHASTERYLIGAEIVNIDDDDKSDYAHLLRFGNRAGKTMTAGLELGID